MSKKDSKKHIPDSHIVYGEPPQTVSKVRAYAETKFGNSFICAEINRQQEQFIVIVKDDAPKQFKEEFEKQWSMCKVLTAIS